MDSLPLSTLAAGLLAATGLCANCATATAPRTATPAASVAPPADRIAARAGSGSLSALFAINEGVAVPGALVRSNRISFAQQADELRADAALVKAVGAGVVRANCHTYPFLNHQSAQRDPDGTRRRADAYMAALDAAGLEAVVVLGPWPCIQTANHTDRYLPDDMDAYAAFVAETVERYDGDGTDDMPGLSRPLVIGWEIDNEPDLHNSVPPRNAQRSTDPSLFETPSEYAQVVRATSAAIRQADPGATVLLGGMYNVRRRSGRDYVDAVLAEPGVREAFDVLSLHCYSDENSLDAIEQTIAAAAELAPGRPLWITEVGVSSQGDRRWLSEDWQAKMLAGIYGAAMRGGAERVFWHTLADPPPPPGGRRQPANPFAHHSLHKTVTSSWDDAGGDGEKVRKPAGEVFARLSALAGDAPAAQVSPLPAEAGRAVQVGPAVYIYWGQVPLPADATVTDLMTGDSKDVAAGDIVTAPAWALPAKP